MPCRSIGRILLSAAVVLTQMPLAWAGESPLVDAQKASTSTGVGREQVDQLPAGRSYADLLTLTPGIADNKASPKDSVNWPRIAMPDSVSQVVGSIDPSLLNEINVLTSGYQAEYGRAGGGVNLAHLGQSYLQDLVRYREWPGESVGLNGTLIATGKAGRSNRVAVLYDDEGYPIDYYTENEIKNHPEDVLDDLHEMCDLISDGKLTVESGKIKASGKSIVTSSGKVYLDPEGYIDYGPPYIADRIGNLAVNGYDWPRNYKLDLNMKLLPGGGMTQLDPPIRYSEIRTDEAGRPRREHQGAFAPTPSQGQPTPPTGQTNGKPAAPTQPAGSGADASTTAPTESVLDDLGPGPTAPLHPNPEGEPTVKTEGDGTVVRTFPDGTTERMSPNGHTFVRYADNATYERHADGTTVDRAPDGSTTTRDKDGKVTSRTGPTVIDLDRKIYRHMEGPMGITPTPKTDKPQTQEKKTPAGTMNKTVSKASVVKEHYAATTLPASMSRQIAQLPDGMKTAPRLASASTTDADGKTTTIARQPDGSVTRTVTDRRGKVLEQGPVTQPEPTRVAPRDGVTRASATDEDGRTVTIEKKDGVTTRTVTDRNGNILERGVVEAPKPTQVPPRTPGVTHASSTDANGNTIAIDKFPDGSSTLTVTDANGKVLQQGPLTAPPPTTAPPRDRITSASTTDANGNTVKVERQSNGSVTRTVTGPDGKVISQGPVERPEPTKVPPRDRVTSASATDANGHTTTVRRAPDGTTTRTVTDRTGKVLEQGPVTAPPPTTALPRDRATSASMRNPDGTTTTIAKQPDGSTVRTVTDRNGNVVERAPVEPPPVTKIPPRTPGATSASTTYPNGNTLTIQRQPDGTVTRTVTDRDGRVIEHGAVPPLEPTKPSKKGPAAPFVSTTDANGNTVMIQRQPNGTMTQTVTDPSGKVLSQGTIEPPPTTRTPPRTPGFSSASATTEDGRTISVTRQPDGTTTRTVTGPDGKVLEQTTTGGPAKPAEPQPPIDPANPATFGLEFAESTGVSVGPDGKVELGPHPPKPPEKQQPDPLGFRESEGVSTPLINDWSGTWSAQPGHSTVPFQPSIGYEPWWDEYYKISDHAPVKADFQAAPQQSSAGSGSAPAYGDHLLGGGSADYGIPSSVTLVVPGIKPQYLDEFVVGAEYEVLEDLRVGLSGQYRRLGEVLEDLPTDGATNYIVGSPGAFRGGFNYHVPGWMPYYGTNPLQPESGVIIGDTVHSNLGTYKVGYRGSVLSELYGTGSGDRVQYFTPRFEGFRQDVGYTPQTGTVPTGPPTIRLGRQEIGPGILRSHPVVELPKGFVPQFVGVLPYGCGHPEKVAVLEEMRSAVDGTLPLSVASYFWEPAHARHEEAKPKTPQPAAGAPNDPLYDKPGEVTAKAGKRAAFDVGQAMSLPASAPREGAIGTAKPKGPKANDQWGLQAVGFTPVSQPGSAWSLVDSDTPNTIVAIIDSGLDLAHPDGPEHLWTNPGEVAGNGKDDDGNGFIDDVHGWNFHDHNADLTDFKGHGTLVAGIIAARRNNGLGIAGINPGAQIMALKVMDPYGKTNSLNVYRAIRYAVAHGARVLNLSLGEAGVSKLEQLAINYAHSHGAVVVVAAGNAGTDTAQYGPAAARRAVTVAGIGMDKQPHKLSNYGVAVALAAPGEEIYSLQSKDAEWVGSPGERERRFRPATGTSFAAPIVAATASLIMAQHPQWPNVAVEDALLGAMDVWDTATGWGMLDAAKALSFDPTQAMTVWLNEVVVNRRKKDVTSVDVFGTVRGVFSTYQVEIGKGRNPSSWQPVGPAVERPITQGLIGRIPGEALKGEREWTVRITAQGGGATRVAQVPVNL